MTAVMVPTSGGSASGNTIASNNRGHADVPGGAEVTLVSFVASGQRLRGFHVYGETDGFAWIEVDGEALDGLSARHSAVKDAYRILPNAEPYASGTSIIALKVLNLSSSIAKFEGVVFGE